MRFDGKSGVFRSREAASAYPGGTGRCVRKPMVNKVYATTHDGLTQLVSARVASQVLDNGLRDARCSAETVSALEMKTVLKSSVLRDLAAILPRAGLELSLKKLAKTLKTLDADETPENAAAGAPSRHAPAGRSPTGDGGAASASLVEAAPGRAVAGAAPDAAPPLLGQPAVEPRVTEHATAEQATTEQATTEQAATGYPADRYPAVGPLTGEKSAGVNVAATGLGPAASPAQVLEPTTQVLKPPAQSSWAPVMDPATRDDLVLAFAQLEHVEMVAVFEGGCVTSVRGDGFEVEALSRLGSLGLKLLGRSGELRTFYVAHSRGQLFLFPFGEVALMLIGSSELNLGLVFATLHKFKEEL